MLALSMGVIAALTVVTLGSFYLLAPAAGPALSVYEMSRLVRGQPLTGTPGKVRVYRSLREPARPSGKAEQVLSRLLASRLGARPEDVRVHLGEIDRERAMEIEREVALYEADRRAEPRVLGTFSIAVRQGGRWRIVSRETYNAFDRWRSIGWQGLLFGFLLVLPLTLWFSARLARPIQAFAASAQRLRGSRTATPVSLAGPTEIRLAAEALNEMQASISRYVRERTALMGAIAHDLRTPLARLRFRLESAPSPLREESAEDIQEMERLIEGILEFVENETRPPLREPLDLSMLVEGIADDFADVGKDVRVIEAEPITTTGDPLLLKRLFANIVDNAVKYGGSAEIAIRQADGQAIVEIADRGRGMREEDITRAFEPFFRGEPSRNRETGGAGLGLSIVKSAAETHEGRVELANAPTGGLLAKVTLPIRLQQPAG